MKKHIIVIAVLSLLVFAIGCGGLAYKQEAGFRAKAVKGETNMVTTLTVGYSTNGAITNVSWVVTGASESSAHDLSNAKLTAFIAKTGAEEMIGDRKGMFDNNSGVTAKGVETEEKLSAVVEKVGDIKKP